MNLSPICQESFEGEPAYMHEFCNSFWGNKDLAYGREMTLTITFTRFVVCCIIVEELFYGVQ